MSNFTTQIRLFFLKPNHILKKLEFRCIVEIIWLINYNRVSWKKIVQEFWANMKIFCNENYFIMSSYHSPGMALQVIMQKFPHWSFMWIWRKWMRNESFSVPHKRATRKHQIIWSSRNIISIPCLNNKN